MSGSAEALAGPRVLADALPGAWVRDLALVGLYALAIGASAQVVIPLQPVPITGQTFAVLLGALALGSRRGVAGAGLYLLLGVAGMPWFAAAGPWTLGYVVGFIAAAGVVGHLAERGWDHSPWRVAAAMVVGNLVIYACGLPVLYALWPVGEPSLGLVVTEGAVKFIPGDLVKIALATGLMPAAWAGVRRIEGKRD